MNRVLRSLGFGLAAVAALFLPVSYFVTVGWLFVYVLPAAYQGEEMPDPGEQFFEVTKAGFYALMIQWPIYLGWVLFTRRLTRRLRFLWIGVLIVFNLFAIPWFLYCMFRRIERTELLRYIRRNSARHYFAKGLGEELPRPPRLQLDLRHEYRQVRFRCSESDVPPEFCIITSCNPDGIVADEESNREADEHLRSEIDRLGFESFSVTGGSPDFSHSEPGYGIVCNRAEALLLARRFRQEAFYEVLGGRVYLVSIHEGHSPGEAVGRWRALVERVGEASESASSSAYGNLEESKISD